MAHEDIPGGKTGALEVPQDATLIDQEFEMIARQVYAAEVPEDLARPDAPQPQTSAGLRAGTTESPKRLTVVDHLRLAAQAFEQNGHGVFVMDTGHRIVLVNRAFEAITGYGQDAVFGKGAAILASDAHGTQVFGRIFDLVSQSGSWEGEIWSRRHNGTTFPARLAMRLVRNASGEVTHHVGTISDISTYKQGEEDLRRQAQHDPLTGLANRSLLNDRLQQAIASCNRSGGRLAVLFLDLDRFKNINDSLGHPVGDKLLHHTARKLKGCVREEDTVARIGGDEFVVVLRNVADAHAAVHVARKIGQEIHGPYRIDGRDLTVTTSIGISLYPDDGGDEYSLIQHADTAMYRAKERGRNSYAFYQQHMTAQAKERLLLENSLVGALKREEFVLHYQPQIDIASGRISGAEALIRWQHAELGLLPPDRFIPLAEDTGLIRPLGAWVMRTVAAQMTAWKQSSLPPMRVAINLSTKQVMRPKHVESLRSLITQAGMPLPGMELEIEITESCIQTGDNTLQTAQALKSMGLTLAIDDFGTGYSSLVSLQQLPIDRIKIDGSFIQRLPTDSNNATITAAMIAMGKALGLRVLAEGVETREQLAFLRSHGCDEAQGFLFSRGMAAEAFRELVTRQRNLVP